MNNNGRGEAFIKWAKAIKERDNYICQVCGKYDVQIHAHHKNSWDIFIEQRYKYSNGVSLCSFCHNLFHKIFGSGNNTEEQFIQFKEIAFSIRRYIIDQLQNTEAVKKEK